ncbi:hypothetical protein NQ317_007499 [Molorchus minor]|uniref:Uncharacterized protein n=1 Tax=Molorchus minor TaxID=1323400 RepID=A0ABQ9K2F8_9CUCU|nr:hypothetical protein NQ317_007499 [Molorchus minor]
MAGSGFVKATSGNLPAVDVLMVAEFMKRDKRFNIAEVRGSKAAKQSAPRIIDYGGRQLHVQVGDLGRTIIGSDSNQKFLWRSRNQDLANEVEDAPERRRPRSGLRRSPASLLVVSRLQRRKHISPAARSLRGPPTTTTTLREGCRAAKGEIDGRHRESNKCGMWAVVAACLCVCVAATPQRLHLEKDSYRRPSLWQKRVAASQENPTDEFSDYSQHMPQLSAINSQLMLRSPRTERPYDVPQIVRKVILSRTRLPLTRTTRDAKRSSNKQSNAGIVMECPILQMGGYFLDLAPSRRRGLHSKRVVVYTFSNTLWKLRIPQLKIMSEQNNSNKL